MPAFTMRLFRGDAKGGGFKDYHVESDEGMVVLDVVHRVQATQAPDLACRWNCKAGKCGSCSAEVNGKPRLMCMTRMDLFQPGDTITIAPIRTFWEARGGTRTGPALFFWPDRPPAESGRSRRGCAPIRSARARGWTDRYTVPCERADPRHGPQQVEAPKRMARGLRVRRQSDS